MTDLAARYASIGDARARRRRRSSRSAPAPTPASAARCTGATEVRAPAGVLDVQPADMTVTVRAGTTLRRARRPRSPSSRPGVPARSASIPPRPSAARSRPGSPAGAGSASDRSATPCSRSCSSRRRSRGARRGTDGEERDRLRRPAPLRRIARHPRCARPGDAADAAGPARVASGSPSDRAAVRAARAASTRPRRSSRDPTGTRVLARGSPRRPRRAGRAAPASRRPTRPPTPDGPHRGRISVAPGRLDAARAPRSTRIAGLDWLAEHGVGTVHVATDDPARSPRRATSRTRTTAGCSARPARPSSTRSASTCPRVALQRRIRAALDPTGKLAPGRVPATEPARQPA